MSKFKVGDRVRALQRRDGELPCSIGTIVSDDLQFCVYFPEWASQHQGHAGLGGGDSYGHWFYPLDTECLELVSDKPDDCDHIRELAEIASYYGVDICLQTGDSTITITSKTKYQED